MSKFKDNIPGFPGYHVTKNGLLYILMNIGNVLVEQSSLIREVERKLSIIPKEKPNIIVITVGRRKDENNKSV